MINEQPKLSYQQEIDLAKLFSVLWQAKRFILIFTSTAALTAVVIALLLPNIYKSEALLAPVSDASGMNMTSQLGSLASLAGINLGGQGQDNSVLALEIVQSREFLGKFIAKHDLFVAIMAAKGWKRDSNELVIDEDIYNSLTKQWVREVNPPYQPKPSLLETYEVLSELISVNQEKTTGMVKISVQHYSPFLAKKMVDDLVKDLNEELRQRDLVQAQRSLDYLTAKVSETNVGELKTLLFSLIEEQTKTLMLANVRDEYVFKTVDPAVVAEKKAKPKRALIVIGITMFAFFISCFVALVRRALKPRQN